MFSQRERAQPSADADQADRQRRGRERVEHRAEEGGNRQAEEIPDSPGRTTDHQRIRRDAADDPEDRAGAGPQELEAEARDDVHGRDEDRRDDRGQGAALGAVEARRDREPDIGVEADPALEHRGEGPEIAGDDAAQQDDGQRDHHGRGDKSDPETKDGHMGDVHLGDRGEQQHRQQAVVGELLRTGPELVGGEARQSSQRESERDEDDYGNERKEDRKQTHRTENFMREE